MDNVFPRFVWMERQHQVPPCAPGASGQFWQIKLRLVFIFHGWRIHRLLVRRPADAPWQGILERPAHAALSLAGFLLLCLHLGIGGPCTLFVFARPGIGALPRWDIPREEGEATAHEVRNAVGVTGMLFAGAWAIRWHWQMSGTRAGICKKSMAPHNMCSGVPPFSCSCRCCCWQ